MTRRLTLIIALVTANDLGIPLPMKGRSGENFTSNELDQERLVVVAII